MIDKKSLHYLALSHQIPSNEPHWAKNLKSITITLDNIDFGFEGFIALERLAVRGVISVNSLKSIFLNLLNLTELALEDDTFLELPIEKTSTLTKLVIHNYNPCFSINAIKHFKHLQVLELNISSHLMNMPFEGFWKAFSLLERIHVNNAMLLDGIDELAKLNTLKYLEVNLLNNSYPLGKLNNILALKDTLVELSLTFHDSKNTPKWIGELHHLEYLKLVNVKAFPRAIRKLSKIRFLCLETISFKSIPRWVGELSTLEELLIIDTPLVSIPNEIKQLNHLSRFEILLCKESIPDIEVVRIRALLPLAHINLAQL